MHRQWIPGFLFSYTNYKEVLSTAAGGRGERLPTNVQFYINNRILTIEACSTFIILLLHIKITEEGERKQCRLSPAPSWCVSPTQSTR